MVTAKKWLVHPVLTIRLCLVEGPSESGTWLVLETGMFTLLALSVTVLSSPCLHLLSCSMVSFLISGEFLHVHLPLLSFSHGTYWKMAFSVIVLHEVVATPHIQEGHFFVMSFGWDFVFGTVVSIEDIVQFVVHNAMSPAIADTIIGNDVLVWFCCWCQFWCWLFTWGICTVITYVGSGEFFLV